MPDEVSIRPANDADLTLRDARPGDIAALASLHVQTFRETHGGGPDASVREHQWTAKFEEPGKLVFCVVLDAGNRGLIGFASGEHHSGDDLSDFTGLLDKIYLLRAYHRRGYGRTLLCAAAERFLALGVRSMLLFGDARSPTNGFYEAMGAERLLSPAGEFHGAYGWRDLRSLLRLCSDRP